jgi:RNA polymerase sigma factor for flagellar operon FliA
VEKEDIQGAAELGLTEAANTFDGRPGVQFKTFGYYRIRGAVYDAIRKATWFSRDQYKEQVAEAAVNNCQKVPVEEGNRTRSPRRKRGPRQKPDGLSGEDS